MELFCVPHISWPYLNLYILSDPHCGCQNWAEKILIHDVNVIKDDPYAMCIIPGDLFQRDIKNHKVGDVYHQAIAPGQQKYYMEKLLTPIKDKLIGMLPGNHDDRGAEDSNEVKDLCKFLGVHYFDHEACISLSVGNMKNNKPAVYTGYGVHGFAGGTIGSIANSLQKLSNVCDADFYFAGHSHQMLYYPVGWFRRDLYNKKMLPVTRHYIAAGSYQGREKYPVTKAMIPKVLGSPLVRMSGVRKEITVILASEFTV